MSAYKLFESIQFANVQLLVSALAELGYEAEVGEAILLRAWGNQKVTAQVVVRREQIKNAGYDLGFVWNGQAFVPVIEDYMAHTSLNEDWRQRLQTTYAKLAALVFCARKQAEIGQVKTLPDGTLTFSATMEVNLR